MDLAAPRPISAAPKERSWYGPACGAASIVFHVVLGTVLHHGRGFLEPEVKPPTTVELTMAPKPIQVPPPEPAVPEPPKPEPKKVVMPPTAPVVKNNPAEPETPPPQMTGRTLTDPSEGDKAWSSLTGNGEAMQGPLIANPAGSPTGKSITVVAPPGPPAPPPGPRFVALKDLARAPRAPNLDDALEKNFPTRARNQGISGSAALRAQVLPDGRIGAVTRMSESSAGFAEACERTLRGSRWSPPLDRGGLPVATEITYTCRFDVRD
jgi:protein TonB